MENSLLEWQLKGRLVLGGGKCRRKEPNSEPGSPLLNDDLFSCQLFQDLCFSLCRMIKSSVGDLESTSCTYLLIRGLLLTALCVEGRFWCYMYAAHIQSTWLSAARSVWYTQEKEPFLCSTSTRQISPNITNWSPSGWAAESGAAAAAAGGHKHICGKISDNSRVTSRSNAFSDWMLEDKN